MSTVYQEIINKNLDAIKGFLYSKIVDVKNGPRPTKLQINCSECNDYKHRLILNLDWGTYRCYKCGKKGSLITLYKELDIYNDYMNLLQQLSNMSLYNIQTLLKSSINLQTSNIKNVKFLQDFIDENGITSINNINNAQDYAMSRVFNDENEISNWYADEKYIYIPIINEGNVTALLGRLYADVDRKGRELPRYNMKVLDDSSTNIGFLDEVSDNPDTNIVYITEGYFDAYSINRAYNDYRAICTFGKSPSNTVISKWRKYFSIDTKFIICYDSYIKDKNIRDSICNLGDTMIKYFTNVHVCAIPEGDPNSIATHKGLFSLREILKKYEMSMMMFKMKSTFL